jgi:hypothetical protein
MRIRLEESFGKQQNESDHYQILNDANDAKEKSFDRLREFYTTSMTEIHADDNTYFVMPWLLNCKY